MIRQFLARLFRRHHYWRGVPFDEMAELYMSRLITVFAVNAVSLFAAVYLYQLGYSLLFIVLFYALFYAVRMLATPIAGKYVAFAGPKHGVLVANILRVPSLIAFAWLPFSGEYSLISIGLFGLFQQISVSLYEIGYMVGFSKVKNPHHTGKEIGIMQQIEKIARVLGPLAGGVIATVWSPEVTIIFTCLLFSVAALPLFKTVEPVKIRTKLKIAGFPWKLAWRSLVGQIAVGVDVVASGMAWTLFLMLTIFAGVGSAVYVSLGGLASMGVFASVVAVWVFGRVIDKRKGDVLLVIGVVVKVITHIFRPFISSIAGILSLNIVAESATSAYSMPITRVNFDVADSSGFRITYMTLLESMATLGLLLACLIYAGVVYVWGDVVGSVVMFFVSSASGLLLLLPTKEAR